MRSRFVEDGRPLTAAFVNAHTFSPRVVSAAPRCTGVSPRDQSQAFVLGTECGLVIALVLCAAVLALPTTILVETVAHSYSTATAAPRQLPASFNATDSLPSAMHSPLPGVATIALFATVH